MLDFMDYSSAVCPALPYQARGGTFVSLSTHRVFFLSNHHLFNQSFSGWFGFIPKPPPATLPTRFQQPDSSLTYALIRSYFSFLSKENKYSNDHIRTLPDLDRLWDLLVWGSSPRCSLVLLSKIVAYVFTSLNRPGLYKTTVPKLLISTFRR